MMRTEIALKKSDSRLKILDLGLNPELGRGAPGGARPLQGYLRTAASADPDSKDVHPY